MSTLNNRIDFMAVISAKNANPNGDPLFGNRPRIRFDQTGIITDVCIKRKIRNRLQDMGEPILYQSNDRADDGKNNIRDRLLEIASINNALMKPAKDESTDIAKLVCENFADVRAFGAVIALKSSKKKDDESKSAVKGTSIGIRGAVTVQMAESVGEIEVNQDQITKSLNGDADEKDRSSDTMGMKYSIPFGCYVIRGSINPIFAGKNGFTKEDAEKIKESLWTLFDNDESAARPAGSMNVERLYWWEEDDERNYSPREVFDTVKVGLKEGVTLPRSMDDIVIDDSVRLPGLEPEIRK